ncbi:hypothetical protein [Methanosarcina sp.]|uniref:hypothetical protein n=1 Tax=Methanosarcina sp. TaxID=2213 RepID=UPI003C73CC5F
MIGTILSIAIALKVLFPAAILEINNFNAGPEIIEPGGSSVLNWGVSGAENITIEPGIGPVSSNGSLSVSPSETTTYKLTAAGKGKEKIASCTVTVSEGSQEPLIISSFDATPDSIKPGESAILNWHVTGVSNVTIEPDIGAAGHTGTLNVAPASTTTYKLTASNDDKEDAAYCTVAVEENPVSPENVPPSELSSAEESLTPDENPAPQDNPASEGDPTSQDNSASQADQASQKSLPSIGSFNANPDAIGKGESSNLIWSVSEASQVSIEPEIGTVGLTGSQRIFPGETTTYTLTATNEFGSVDATKVIFVQEPSAPAPKEPVSTPSPAPISTPEQFSPADGTVFDNFTSGITLEWKAVPGAASYTVEIDEYDSGSGLWLSDSARSRMESGITATSYSFEPAVKSPGRWRVWAAGSDGQESEKSGWWDFNYNVESSQA